MPSEVVANPNPSTETISWMSVLAESNATAAAKYNGTDDIIRTNLTFPSYRELRVHDISTRSKRMTGR